MTSQVIQSIALEICVRFNSAEDFSCVSYEIVCDATNYCLPSSLLYTLPLAVELLRELLSCCSAEKKIAEVSRNFL